MTGNEVLIKTPEEAIETIKSNMPISGYLITYPRKQTILTTSGR